MLFGQAADTNNAATLLKELGIGEENMSVQLQMLAETDSRYLKDLKINITNALQAETLGKKEAFLIAFAVAVNEKNSVLQKAFEQKCSRAEVGVKELAEVISCVSLMNANNIYYRFRHFMEEEFYNNAQAGIRMSIMANPSLGKELFELISLVISAVNGCQLCVASHEKALLGHGTG